MEIQARLEKESVLSLSRRTVNQKKEGIAMSLEKQDEKMSQVTQVTSDAAEAKPTELSVDDLDKVAGGLQRSNTTGQTTVSWETHEIKV